MKEISLKKPADKTKNPEVASLPKEIYPSFSIWDKAPEELMKLEIGAELTAKIKLSSKENHEGTNTRKGVGFDVISVIMDEKPVKKLQKNNAMEHLE